MSEKEMKLRIPQKLIKNKDFAALSKIFWKFRSGEPLRPRALDALMALVSDIFAYMDPNDPHKEGSKGRMRAITYRIKYFNEHFKEYE